ncbi:LysR family transcriptional regulator [Photobacterium sp. 1_MG-2023]|uniref:LysR family transcriptional regulator n=1 Tax=Photobacterium sp. 1_MG-2023 TaxID=3062646 RepID=UPI0026E32286|nr:LysR family transcriptional regulator [Photobacterium sp. 1_MG-2023]MDO6708667.1 LysR family transcriptional regulator [Photobacterium sp. 1_MG-2023]
MAKHVSLRQLEYLVALADTGQVSRAAQRCNVSQSSMTIALRKLEHALGSNLFLRHARGIRLTEAGDAFVLKARRILLDIDDAIDAFQRPPSSLSGWMRIGITETISAYLLPSLKSVLERQFPNQIFEFYEFGRAAIEKAVRQGDLELGIILVSNTDAQAELTYETMLRSERQLWMDINHPMQYPDTISLADVATADFILLDMDEHIETVNQYWGSEGLLPNPRFKSRSLEAVRSLVAMGQGVTILSDFVYRQLSLEGRRIIRRSLKEKLPTMDVGCVWRHDKSHSERIKPVIEFIRKKIGDDV